MVQQEQENNLILLDNRIQNIEQIIQCLMPNTDYIIFDYYEDTYLSITEKIEKIWSVERGTKYYNCVSIAQHNYNTSHFYFLEKETLTTHAYTPQAPSHAPIIYSVAIEDPFLVSWSPFIQFLQQIQLNYNVQYFDFLACSLWASEDWVYIINRIRSSHYNIYIRASVDYTGGGEDSNFVLESDGVDTIGLYFTDAIREYGHVLFITYPSPPIINTITPQDKSLLVYVMDLDNGGSPITKYMYSLNDSSYVDLSGDIVSPFIIDGLINGNEYTVKIKAFNGTYESYPSDPWFPVIPYAEINEPIVLNITLYYPSTLHMYGQNTGGAQSDPENISIIFPPSTPVITNVIAGNENAMVEFTQEHDGGAPILYYKYSLNDLSYSVAEENASPIIINGLTNETEYTVKIIANNGYVDSLPSLISSPFMPYPSMYPPVITSVSPSNQQITVYFTHNNNGYTISHYTYTLDGGQTYIQASTTSSPLIITGLTNDTQYSFTMVAHATTGEQSLPSNTVVNIVPYTTPDTPIITRIEPFDKSIHIYYDASVNSNGRPLINFVYSLNGGATYTSASQTSNPIIITGLVNGTKYNVVVKSLNTAGYSQASNAVEAIPANVPSTPIITNVAVNNVNVTITFTPSNDNGSPIQKYQYKLTNTAFIDIPSIVNNSSFTLLNLAPANYSIAIRSVNSIGASSVSNSASFTTLVVVPPTAPIITGVIYVRNTNIATIRFTQPATVLPVNKYIVSINGGGYVQGAYDGRFIYVPNLRFGENYSFKIKGVNAFGTSEVSNESDVIEVCGVPSTPYIWKINANYGNTEVYYTRLSDNGTPIIRMQYKLNNGAWVSILNPSSPLILPSLPNNSVNVISLKAVNLAGESDVSTSRTFRVSFSLPQEVKSPNIDVNINYITVYPKIPDALANIPITSITYLLYRNGIEDASAITVPFSNPFTILDTPANVEYTIKLTYITPIGTTVYSKKANPKTYYSQIPETPIIYTVRMFNDKAHIYILEVEYKTIPKTISYLYSLNGSPYIDSYTNDDNMPIVCDISANVQYELRVKARNSSGLSPESDTSRFISSFGVPKRPYLGKPVMTSTTLRATMSPPVNTGGTPILGYKFSFDGKTYLPIYNSTTHLIISALTPDTNYLIYLVAYNANGTSEPYVRWVKTLP